MRTMSEIESIEKQLIDFVDHRRKTQSLIEDYQKDLDRFIKMAPKRPKDSLQVMQNKIQLLERERTIHSLPLKEEKLIIKQITKLEREKREAEDFEAHDAKIKNLKELISNLRKGLKDLGDHISECRLKLGVLQSAKDLDCSVEELVGVAIHCPRDKLGQVIGKKGSKVKELMEKSNVLVDIEREQGSVRVIGTIAAVNEASKDLNTVIARKSQLLHAPPLLIEYLCTKHITALNELRDRHPDIQFNVSKDDMDEIPVTALPEDVESFKRDLMTIRVEQKTLQVPASTLPALIGRKGMNIDQIVAKHQIGVKVEKPKADEENGTVTILGPIANMDAAEYDIMKTVEGEEQMEETIRLDPVTRKLLIMRSTDAMQELYRVMNAATESIGPDKCIVTLEENACVIKGKRKCIQAAVGAAEQMIRQLESSCIRISVDEDNVGRILGKGGENIKAIQKDFPKVSIEVDNGEFSICSLVKEDAEKVRLAVSKLIEKNAVRRFKIDRKLPMMKMMGELRSKLAETELKDRVSLVLLKDDSCILARGTDEDLKEVASLLESVFEANYFDTLPIAKDDVGTLLAGGKNSQVAKIQESRGVMIHLDRESDQVEFSGSKEAVRQAITELQAFLFGCDDFAVSKLPIEKSSVPVVIGRKGKTKKELQDRYKGVSILIGPGDETVILRGPPEAVEQCRVEISKLIRGARVSKSISFTSGEFKKVKSSRILPRLMKVLQLNVDEKDNEITIYGPRDDLNYATDLIDEVIKGVYKSHVYLAEGIYKRIEAGRDPAFLKHIEETSGASISFSSELKAVVFEGTKANVISTKDHFYRFLGFLLSSSFSRIDIDGPGVTKMMRSGVVAEACAKTGCEIQFDRDAKVLLVFGSDSEKTKEANKLIASEVAAAEKLISEIRVDSSEAWVVSSLIGTKGKNISALRKEASMCNIGVDSIENSVTISADTESKVLEGKAIVEKALQAIRDGQIFVKISEEDLPAFIGKGGKNIKEFRKNAGVEVQVTDDRRLQFVGEKERLAEAKKMFEEWLKNREDAQQELNAFEEMRIKANEVPAVIGTKGATVSAIQKEFGCRVDINRENAMVRISRGSPEKRQQTIERIRQVLAENAANSEGPSVQVSNITSVPESSVAEKTELGTEPGTEDNTLSSGANTEHAVESPPSGGGHKIRHSLSFEEMVSQCDWDADADPNDQSETTIELKN